MKRKIIFWVLAIVGGCFLGLVVFPAIIKSCSEYAASENKKAAERQAEREALVLTKKEAELWTEVYAAGVRRGVWYPAERANDAIIELRQMQGEQDGK